MCPQAARPARPARSARPALPSTATLDQTHRRMIEVLAELRSLVGHLDADGVDAAARASAATIRDFLADNARAHHAEEERLVFPALLRDGDAELVQDVLRLQQDHGWLEEDWLELEPQLEAVANGYSWYDLDLLRQAVDVYASLYIDHIALEESRIYPAWRRRQAGSDV